MSQSTPDEAWLPVPGYEGLYEVSDRGRVWSIPHMTAKGMRGGTFLAGSQVKGGHIAVMLSKDGKVKRRMIHQLVAEAFIGPRPEGQEVLHFNDIGWDNNLSNLRYGTRAENQADALRNGRNRNANQTHCPQGHPYDDANTYHRRDGGRDCKACNNESGKRRSKRRQAGIGVPCLTPGCDGAQRTRGLCPRCYARKLRADKRASSLE